MSTLRAAALAAALLFATAGTASAATGAGQWGIDVAPVKTAAFDPIVFPGDPVAGHLHEFQGNLGINPDSTTAQLFASPTNSGDSLNHSAYWTPALIRTFNGRVVPVHKMHVYYRKATADSVIVKPLPKGLKIIAGDPHATAFQSASVTAWRCNEGGTTTEAIRPPLDCPVGVDLVATIRFPNCWDGVRLDSLDHRSHMAYQDAAERCPSSHPVRVPQIQEVVSWSVPGIRGLRLSSDDDGVPAGASLHGDDWIVWDEAEMQRLVDRCMNGMPHDCGNIVR